MALEIKVVLASNSMINVSTAMPMRWAMSLTAMPTKLLLQLTFAMLTLTAHMLTMMASTNAGKSLNTHFMVSTAKILTNTPAIIATSTLLAPILTAVTRVNVAMVSIAIH